MASTVTIRRCVIFLAIPLLLAGCVLSPPGTEDERQRLTEVGNRYEPPIEQRVLPELGAQPQWRDVLHRAFLANGELEAAYFEWKAAFARIDMAAAYPNTNLSLGFEYMFSSENMKSWDRTTITAAPDAMQNLSFPTKVMAAGRVAMGDAQAAGKRFAANKFDLQKQVLTAWLDYALMAERVRIAEANVSLLRLIHETASKRVQAGGMQQDLLKAGVELRMAEDELKTMQSQLPQMQAMLNGMLARDPDAQLSPPAHLPEARRLPADDKAILAIGVNDSPELAMLARRTMAREAALDLALQQFIPDINPVAGLTGSIERFVGAMVTLPTAIPMIQGQIREARAMLRANEAMTRQTRLDRNAQFVAALYALRNSERQMKLFEDQIMPTSKRVLENTRQAYSAGTVGFVELIDSQRTLLEVREIIAEARVARDKRIAELEALAGVDFETLEKPTVAPTKAPSTAN